MSNSGSVQPSRSNVVHEMFDRERCTDCQKTETKGSARDVKELQVRCVRLTTSKCFRGNQHTTFSVNIHMLKGNAEQENSCRFIHKIYITPVTYQTSQRGGEKGREGKRE